MNYVKNLAKQAFAGVVAIAFAAALISLVAPKAVHAAAAALLVQVTNTSDNPVPTTDESLSASHLITLYCPGMHTTTSQTGNCYQLGPNGTYHINVPYQAPAGQSLVVTDIQINTDPGGGTELFYMTTTNGTLAPQVFYAPSDGNTHLFSLTRGIVMGSGLPVLSFGTYFSTFLQGYVTAN